MKAQGRAMGTGGDHSKMDSAFLSAGSLPHSNPLDKVSGTIYDAGPRAFSRSSAAERLEPKGQAGASAGFDSAFVSVLFVSVFFASGFALPPLRLRRLRRRLRPEPCFGAGRFSASATATSWIVPSRSRASSMSFVALGV
jgi:hypothetical protein